MAFASKRIGTCETARYPAISRWPQARIGFPFAAGMAILPGAAAVEFGGILRYTGRSQLRGPQQPGLLAPGWAGAYSRTDPKSMPDDHYV